MIDNEHAFLIDALGRLKKVCPREESRCDDCDAEQIPHCDKIMSELVANLLGYMVEHFAQEEDLMRTIDVPIDFRQQHAEEHANIAQRARTLIENNPIKVVVKPTELHNVLAGWLETHINDWDMRITDRLERVPSGRSK